MTPTARPRAWRGVPRPPDAGFFGRDETLLAIDRKFDTQQVVLLHAYAGAGKTTTAAEFARWYAATGGLHHAASGHRAGAVVLLRAPPAPRPAAGRRRGHVRPAAGGQRHPLAGPHQHHHAPRAGAASPAAGAGAVGMGQHRASHRVPPRHSQRLDSRGAGSDRRVPAGPGPAHPVQGAADLPPRRTALAGRPARPRHAAADADARTAPARRRPGRPPPRLRPGHRLAAAAALRRGQPTDHHRPDQPGPPRPPHHHRPDRRVRDPTPGRGNRPGNRGGRRAGPGPVPGRLAVLRVHPRLHPRRTRPARRPAPVPRHHRRRRPPLHGRPRHRR